MKLFSLPAASALAACILSVGAFANNNSEPGSLLVFPLFDNTAGSTVISVVNTNDDFSLVNQQTGQLAGTVKVEFVYVSQQFCFEFNRTRTLSPNDEFTINTATDNPGMQQGYLYVFAKSFTTGAAIKFDWLIGSEWQLDGAQASAFEIDPYVYKAGARILPGGNTDLDQDGIRDLNGSEYEQSPDRILVPRFFGQVPGPGALQSELILINLTGGGAFQASVNFWIYNDNEEAFSSQYVFSCWTRVPLSTISGTFQNSFLLSTGHSPTETTGLTVNNQLVETGWYRIDGGVAASSATSFLDPTILAMQIESLGTYGSWSNLPFTTGTQANGDLILHGVLGDTN